MPYEVFVEARGQINLGGVVTGLDDQASSPEEAERDVLERAPLSAPGLDLLPESLHGVTVTHAAAQDT